MYRLTIIIFSIVIYSVKGSKYCSYEINGEPKYFICARNEYCCNFGCCVHLAFQFYQLWYYWLLLIFMFMICSGGSWWYKFCRQNDTTSQYPSMHHSGYNRHHIGASSTSATGVATSSAAVAAAAIAAARHNTSDSRRFRDRSNMMDTSSFYLQRIWKANGMTPPPNYYTASVVRYHSASELETRRQQQECPYYQLYGPPPSYESIVQMPEHGHGQPSCTLISSINPQQQHQVQDQVLPTQSVVPPTSGVMGCRDSSTLLARNAVKELQPPSVGDMSHVTSNKCDNSAQIQQMTVLDGPEDQDPMSHRHLSLDINTSNNSEFSIANSKIDSQINPIPSTSDHCQNNDQNPVMICQQSNQPLRLSGVSSCAVVGGDSSTSRSQITSQSSITSPKSPRMISSVANSSMSSFSLYATGQVTSHDPQNQYQNRSHLHMSQSPQYREIVSTSSLSRGEGNNGNGTDVIGGGGTQV